MDDPRSDGDVLGAVAGGDREALRVLYDRHAPWLTVRLSRRCADPDVVDEVVQDTFLAVWRSAGRWRGSGEVGAWIWGIGMRRLVDVLRRRRRWGLRISLDDGAARETAGVSAEEQALLDVEYGDLDGALRRLSPELRAVVQATVLDGLTTREASRLLGVPHGTVKTRMMRARMQLREGLA
ncbi:MAG: RNA polymerase sigma factor [Egibacteraceae bacterium]